MYIHISIFLYYRNYYIYIIFNKLHLKNLRKYILKYLYYIKNNLNKNINIIKV